MVLSLFDLSKTIEFSGNVGYRTLYCICFTLVKFILSKNKILMVVAFYWDTNAYIVIYSNAYAVYSSSMLAYTLDESLRKYLSLHKCFEVGHTIYVSFFNKFQSKISGEYRSCSLEGYRLFYISIWEETEYLWVFGCCCWLLKHTSITQCLLNWLTSLLMTDKSN